MDRFLFSENSETVCLRALNFHTPTIGHESSDAIKSASFLDRKAKRNEGRRTILLCHPVNRER